MRVKDRDKGNETTRSNNTPTFTLSLRTAAPHPRPSGAEGLRSVAPARPLPSTRADRQNVARPEPRTAASGTNLRSHDARDGSAPRKDGALRLLLTCVIGA